MLVPLDADVCGHQDIAFVAGGDHPAEQIDLEGRVRGAHLGRIVEHAVVALGEAETLLTWAATSVSAKASGRTDGPRRGSAAVWKSGDLSAAELHG
jgi:hypothetical protein